MPTSGRKATLNDTDGAIYPVTSTECVVDADGSSAEERITALESDLDSQVSTINSELLGKFPVSSGVSDLNAAPSGNRAIIPTTNPANFPSGLGGNNALVLQQGGASFAAQLAFGFNSDKIAIRRKVSGTWTSWKYFTAT